MITMVAILVSKSTWFARRCLSNRPAGIARVTNQNKLAKIFYKNDQLLLLQRFRDRIQSRFCIHLKSVLSSTTINQPRGVAGAGRTLNVIKDQRCRLLGHHSVILGLQPRDNILLPCCLIIAVSALRLFCRLPKTEIVRDSPSLPRFPGL